MILTVQQHILAQQREHFPEAGGQFSWLLSGLTLASKMIEAKVRRAGLIDILGAAGEINARAACSTSPAPSSRARLSTL